MTKLTKYLALALCCAAGIITGPATAQETIKIGVSIPSADHGWTGGVNYFARS